jgi:hypothetical protein
MWQDFRPHFNDYRIHQNRGSGYFFSRPDHHGGAVKWQRACAAWIGKSGGVLFGGHRMLFSAGNKIKSSCRLGAQAAMIRHLVVEKISLPSDFSTNTYLIYEIEVLVLPL